MDAVQLSLLAVKCTLSYSIESIATLGELKKGDQHVNQSIIIFWI